MKSGILLALLSFSTAIAQPRPLDSGKSTITVHVSKTGLFSAFGHDHEISAPVAKGTADPAAHHVELQVDAAKLKVVDAKVSEKDRAEIQQTMLGPEVLDVARYPVISFRSSAADATSDGVWKVRGSLTLHGQTEPIVVDVREKDGRYEGSAIFKQTAFGIVPVKAGGGTVRVKDEVRIEFDIQLGARE